MKAVPVFEAKNRLSELIAAVEHGDQVTITRRGVPVARLVAEPAKQDAGQRPREVKMGSDTIISHKNGVRHDYFL